MSRMLKGIVQHAAHRLGFSVARTADVLQPDVDLLALLWRWCGGGAAANFIQIGGNDGLRFDPLQELVRTQQLAGLIVEPLPHACESLRSLWRDRPEIQIVEAAVSAADGEVPLWRLVSTDPRRTEELSVLASLDHRYIQRVGRTLRRGDRIEALTVPAISISRLLKLAGERLDLLVVDVEGLDDQCVHGVLDQGIRPRLVCYEHVHLTPRSDAALIARLRGDGYKLLRAGWDTYAVVSSQDS